MGALDPNAYVEPMELYDSIFWGKVKLIFNFLVFSFPATAVNCRADLCLSESPDPWNSGVDAMSFDFLAQPPPGQPPQQQFYF